MDNRDEFYETNTNEESQGEQSPVVDTVESSKEPEVVQEEPVQYQQAVTEEQPPLDKKVQKRIAKDQLRIEKIKKKQEKKVQKAARKRKSFGRVLAFGLSAILLGSMAGGAFYGVAYVGNNLFPFASTESDSSGTSASIAQVNTTVSDDNITTTVYDVSDMVSSVITSVVAINGIYTSSVDYGFFGNQSYESTVSGSGIIIGTNEDELLIVTNAHVVEDIDDLAITLYNGDEVSAVVKGIKSSYDLAVLAVNLSDIPSDAVYTIATLGDSNEVEVGEAAIAVGNSMGYGISVTTGVISAIDRTVTVEDVDYNNLIQTDAAINPGNSGGALFNANGEVIGINSVKMTDTDVEGMGYAISISSVLDVIEDLSLQETKIQLSDEERGYLGVSGLSITEEISETYGYPVGVLIKSISEDSSAELAGLKKNDIITAFDGQTVATIDELVDLMAYYAVGDTVEVEYYHMNSEGEYEKTSVTLTLTEKPE